MQAGNHVLRRRGTTFLAIFVLIGALWGSAQERETQRDAAAANVGGGAAANALATLRSPSDVEARLEPFERWFTALRRGELRLDPSDVELGLVLARERREAMKALVQSDPAAALARALPRELRTELPREIASELEQWVEGTGDFDVSVACFGPNRESQTLRKVVLDGKKYEARVYGRRLWQATKHGLPLTGVAVDDQLALDENPWRRLEPQEASIRGFGAETIVLRSGEEVKVFADSGSANAWQTNLLEREARLGPVLADGDPGTPQPQPPVLEDVSDVWTLGEKSVLFLRVEFPDDRGLPASDQAITNEMAAVSQFFLDASYGRCWFRTTVVPGAFLLSRTKAYFNTNNVGQGLISDEALQGARDYDAAHGATGLYNPDSYDRWIVVFKYVTSFHWTGRATLGGKGLWLNGGINRGTAAHELGHNHGLWHSHSWAPTASSPIYPGQHVEYGDSFDIMGLSDSMPAGHFNTKQKETILFLETNRIVTVINSGTYRLNRHDHRNAGGVQAIKINAGRAYDYWIEYRRQELFEESLWPWLDQTELTRLGTRMRNGVLLHWGKYPPFATGPGTYLLDATATSVDGTFDAPLAIGEMFSDPDYWLHITPVANGGTSPSEWIDVRVDFGAVGGTNRNPILTFAPPPGELAARTEINFTASATDPDGDPVYFRWDFDDLPSSTNTMPALIQRRWLKGGNYTVQCIVLDGRGGFASKSFNLLVKDPLVSWTRRAEGLTTATIRTVVFAGGQFVALAEGCALRSSDGINWAKREAFSPAILPWSLCYGANRYVAVASYGRVFISDDGLSWNTLLDLPITMRSIAYGNGRFVAVGEAGRIFHSTDGLSWVEAISPITTLLSTVSFSGNRFVAVGSSGRILTSTNGIGWQNVSVASSDFLSGVASLGGTWFATSGLGTWTSPDATNWTKLTSGGPSRSLNSFTALPGVGMLFGPDYPSVLGWSEDGSNWAWQVVGDAANWAALNGIAEGNGSIVLVGQDGLVLQTQFSSPTLSALRLGANLVLSWPTNFYGFSLESATNIGLSALWAPVGQAPTIVADKYAVTNPITGPGKYYRLKR